MARKIYDKSISGIVNEAHLLTNRRHYENLLTNSMRDEGLVPVLDLNPIYSLNFDKEEYHFELTMYFVKVDKKGDAYRTEGMSDGRFITIK